MGHSQSLNTELWTVKRSVPNRNLRKVRLFEKERIKRGNKGVFGVGGFREKRVRGKE